MSQASFRRYNSSISSSNFWKFCTIRPIQRRQRKPSLRMLGSLQGLSLRLSLDLIERRGCFDPSSTLGVDSPLGEFGVGCLSGRDFGRHPHAACSSHLGADCH
eukprot:TRINITY_DN1978_c0_g2_i2.p1 TRINITY_DN1978_c0_g2~~TRINITY_DN1978_c0_g2_i2.p1  ORF type:complete len:103 (+),score=4.86 TRINITY_DN1978_c0_g2_i2:342-650(+)